MMIDYESDSEELIQLLVWKSKVGFLKRVSDFSDNPYFICN